MSETKRIYVRAIVGNEERPNLYIDMNDTQKMNDYLENNPLLLLNREEVEGLTKAIVKDVVDEKLGKE
jgi:hypothetical protein